MKPESAFKQTHRDQLAAILEELRSQLLDEVVPFWQDRVLDREYGGYLNFFDRTGNCYDGRKPGWFAGRTLSTFAGLYRHIEPRSRWMEIARAGRDYLDTAFYAGNGRFNQMMSRDGRVLAGTTSIFTDHFAVEGLYAYIAACGEGRRQEDLELARLLTQRLFANVEDAAVLRAEGIPPGLQKHAVNFLTLLVAQESRAIFVNDYSHLVRPCVEKSLYVFANDDYEAPLEYVGADGKPSLQGVGRLIDPGHTMESLWFSMREGVETGEPELIRRAGQVLDWVIDRCYDQEYGGFYQHVDLETTTPEKSCLTNDYGGFTTAWDDKIWWVQAEGLVALAMSALLNENPRHYRLFLQLYDYVNELFRDREYGEWYGVRRRDGAMRSDDKGTAFKGPYHVPRCLMQLVLQLEEYLQ